MTVAARLAHMNKLILPLAAVLALILALPPAAHASRAPTPRERAELIGATHLDRQIPPRREWPAKKVWVSDLRISTVNHTWAAGVINEIFHGSDDGAPLLYHFRDRAWHLRTIGGPCPLPRGVPRAVMSDLMGTTCESAAQEEASEEAAVRREQAKVRAAEEKREAEARKAEEKHEAEARAANEAETRRECEEGHPELCEGG